MSAAAGPGPVDHGPSVDFTLKTIIIGESAAGKSSLLQQFVNGKLNEISKHTVGVEFGSRTIVVPSEEDGSTGASSTVKLQIWDTAGQDRFRSITRSYYRGAVGCLAVFALNDRSSFDALPQWIKDAKSQAGEGVTIVIVGNKTDVEEERQVPMLEAAKFAQEHGCAYVETSAKTGDNVEPAFFKLARSIIAKIQSGQLDGANFASVRAPARGPGRSIGADLKSGAPADGAEGCIC